MASADCTASLGLRSESTATKTGRKAAIISVGALATASPYASGNSFTRDAITPKAWLPGAQVPIGWVTIDKKRYPVEIEQAWFRFCDYFANRRLAGINGPSVTEIEDNVVDTRVQAVNAAAQAAAVADQSIANAEVLKATVQVAENNGLSGATNIPDVVLRPRDANTAIQ